MELFVLGGVLASAVVAAALRLPLRPLHAHLLRHPHAWRCPRCCGASPSSSSGSPAAPTGCACPRRRCCGGSGRTGTGQRQARASCRTATTSTSLALFVGCVVVMWVIVHSPFGKALQAIRDNETRAEFVGVQVLALPAGRLPGLGHLHRARGRALGAAQRPHHPGHPPLDVLGRDRLLHRAGRLPDLRRAPSSAPSSSTTSRTYRGRVHRVLAARAGRRAGGPGAGRCPPASWAAVGRLGCRGGGGRRHEPARDPPARQVLRRDARGGPRRTSRVNEGEVLALIGSNGAGKTTLGEPHQRPDPAPTSGTIVFQGADITRASVHEKIARRDRAELPAREPLRPAHERWTMSRSPSSRGKARRAGSSRSPTRTRRCATRPMPS